MKKTFKILLTAMLLIAALAFCVSAAPSAVVVTENAVENYVPVENDGVAELLAISGSGTATDPFIVVTEEDLMLVSDFPDCHFKLANDIALTSTDWEPLCVLGDPFSGTFDGDGYTISNLTIATHRRTKQNGLFSRNAGTIKNLNVLTSESGITGGASRVGILAGQNTGYIEKCSAYGTIRIDDQYYSYDTYIGGLIGRNYEGVVDKCFADTFISVTPSDVTSFDRHIGGLVGENASSSSTARISDSFAMSSINYGITNRSLTYICGLVGYCVNESSISNSYAVVSGASMDYGLTYSSNSLCSVTNSFYDRTVSGLTDTSYGTPKTTAAMKMSQTYTNAGWDFENTWAISDDINDGYPYLQWMYETTYKVTYDANGGVGAPDSQRKYEDADLVLSDVVPTREGYKFLGWATQADANAVEYIAGATYSENAELTLYAVWEKVYYITYNANGGSNAPETQTKEKNVDIALTVATPTQVGYKFLGWASSADAEEVEYLPGDVYSLNSDLDLYAVWEKLYVITYDCTAISTQYKEADVEVSISAVMPSMELREFLGWATSPDSDVVEYNPGDKYSENADLNLYAVWKNLYVDINIGAKTSSTNVRYYEVNGNQYALTETSDNLLRVVPTSDMFIEIVEKESADSRYTVSAKYYLVDFDTLTYSELTLDSFINNVGNPSIRVSEPTGIRFKSTFLTLAKREESEFVIEEYGFVVALQSHLDAAGAQLNFDFSKYIKGVAYSKYNGIDKIFDSSNDEALVFSGVLYNIPDTAYEEKITSKTYTKIKINGESFTVYGEASSASMYEIAKSLVDSDEITEEARAELQKIIEKVEGVPPADDELDNEIEIEGDDLFD